MNATSDDKAWRKSRDELESILKQPYQDVCNVCKGAGHISAKSRCPKCKGSGRRYLKLL
ncbi:MAG: hypothetical protein MRY76_02310 [Pseudomonadales bacterium]|nr:hypothetical protein [Pseudomonadales bacterium]